MNWFLIALIPPAVWAATNHFDKYLLSFPTVLYQRGGFKIRDSIRTLALALQDQASVEGIADFSDILLRRGRFSPGSELGLDYLKAVYNQKRGVDTLGDVKYTGPVIEF